MTTKVLIVFALLLTLILASCAPAPVQLEEEQEVVEETEVMEEEEEQVEEVVEEEEEMEDGFYKFWDGETHEILGRSITFVETYQPITVVLVVDGEEVRITNTKQDEIINGLRIELDTWVFESSTSKNNFVILKIAELDLANNQFLIHEAARMNVGDKDVRLEESKSNGYILLSVYEADSSEGDTDVRIRPGGSEKVNGLTITNLENWWQHNEYAIIQID